ncbi:MAG: hypothetical protein AAGJ46_17710 [Planctomycetota bacterium]
MILLSTFMAPTELATEARAASLHRHGRSPAAVALIDDAISRTPERASLWVLRSIIRHGRGEWSAALADAEMALTLAPLPVGGQLVLADCYSRLGHRELAIAGFLRVVERSALPSPVYARLYSGFRRCGRVDLALRACQAAVEASPADSAAYFAAAHCMASLHYSAASIARMLRQAVAISPSNRHYRISLAIHLVRDGKLAEAHHQLQLLNSTDLAEIECPWSARKLLRPCLWAKDAARAAVLREVLAAMAAFGDVSR